MGHYSNYILLRIVRLTIETNAVTGIQFVPCSTLYRHSFIPLKATVAIASLVLYIAFPVRCLRAVLCLLF